MLHFFNKCDTMAIHWKIRTLFEISFSKTEGLKMKKGILSKRIISLILVLITTVSVCFVGVNAVLNFEDEYKDFLEKLGYYESRNTYNIKNEYGYMGRWQLGYSGLIDIGFMDWDYEYTALAAKYGVYSDKDFLESPEAQDYCVQQYHRKMWSYIEWYGDEKYVGKKYEDITITVSGLIGAAHLAGAGGLHEMLKTGITATDAYGSEATFYLKELAGYNISKSIGASVYDVEPEKPQEKEIPSSIKFYKNYSGINYMLGTDYSKLDTSHVKARNTSMYTLSVDSFNSFEGKNSLKIVSKAAGNRNNNDLMLYTDTNDSYEENGIGDDKQMTLSFYAKANSNNTKMYWRWGYGEEFGYVTLSTSWKKYTLTFRKKPVDGSTLHPYFDRAATVYLNDLMLVDGDTAPTSVVYETAADAAATVNGIYKKSCGSLPVVSRSGYKFEGWYTDKNGGTKLTNDFKMKERTMKAYARWSKITSYYPIASGEYSGHYYSIFNDDLSWEQAKTACEKMGGHLVSVNSSGENTFLTKLISKTDKGNYWIGCSNTSGSWKWVTGESFSFTKWASGQPSGGSEHYGEMYAVAKGSAGVGQWNDIAGTTSQLSFWSLRNTGYICEFEPEDIVISQSYYNNGKAYSVVNSQISWDNARYYSEKVGGHLVTINNSDENAFVNSIVSKSSRDFYWIGAYDKANDGKFSWVTGESFSFTNWGASNPSGTNGIERCVEIYKNGLKWNDVKNLGRDNCTTGFIIETDNYTAKLKSIAVSSKPDKTVYKLGESLDLKGMNVTATYDTGEVKTVSGYSVTGYSPSTIGTQKITVSYQGKTASFNVTVKDYPTSLDITKLPTKTNYVAGEALDTKGIKVVATFKSGEKRNIVTSYKVSGYDKNKAGQQTVTLTYTSAGVTVKDSFNVNVQKNVPVQSVKLNKSSVSVKIGKTSTLTATVLPEDANNKKVTFTSSNTAVATVSSSGKITGKSAGTAVITATSQDGSHTAKCTVTVRDYPVALNITKLPNKTNYYVGEALDTNGIKVVATFKSGEKRNVVTAYKVSGYDKNKAGQQTVTLSYTSASVTVTDSFTVTLVNKIKVTGVSLNKAIKYVKYGQSVSLSASVLPSNASDKGVTFTSSNSSVASVSPSGEVTGKTLGTATITVKTSDGGYKDSITITVRDYPLYLTVTKNPTKTVYNKNENFDTTGMVAYATFATGEKRKITKAYKISGYDKTKRGLQKVTVSYTSCSVTVTDAIWVTVK